MPRFAANLSMLFNEHEFLARFEAAARAGFKGVEFMFPYPFKPEDVAEQIRSNGLELALFNLPPGNWEAGERGIACLPDRREEFRDAVAKGIEYARVLGAPKLNCLAGIPGAGVDHETARRTLIDNLRYAGPLLAAQNIVLVVEAINIYDIPGFFLNRSGETIALLDEVGVPNIKLQYDIYHMQRMEGEIAATLKRLLPRIGHVQIADNPGRNEPGTGEINFPFLFRYLDAIGYDGWVGCEYRPANGTEAGLGWLPPVEPEFEPG